MTHSEQATQYAYQVTEGKIPACKWVKLAARRHIDDLSRPDFPYVYSDAHGNRACDFIEALPHVKGRWAAKRELLILQPWQKFIVCSLFGWLNKETGLRRFREAYICVPRKNGKSPLAAAIGLYMLAADHEVGAEVYCGATSQLQAYEVFRPAHQMVSRTPDLQKFLGVKVNAQSLVVESTGSRFTPVIGRPGDGASPSCGIADEYHEAVVPDLYDTFKTGMIGREQPLLLTITTAGFDTSSPCHELQITAQMVLEKTLDDESMFVVVYTIDVDDDWTKPEALYKANPNLGVSISAETLIHDQQNAVKNSAKANVFRTKHLCEWRNADTAFFNMGSWATSKDESLDEAEFNDDPMYIGVDLASQIDLSAVVKVYVRNIDGKMHFYLFPRFYLPEDRINEPEAQIYQKWAEEGDLIPTEGASIDYAQVRTDLVNDVKTGNIRAVCYDERYAGQLMQELGILTQAPLVQVPQRTEFLSLPMLALDAAILDGRVHHNGNPVMSWCMANVVAHADVNGNVFPRKLKPEHKIDGAVAAINAMNRAITCDAIKPRNRFAAFKPFNL